MGSFLLWISLTTVLCGLVCLWVPRYVRLLVDPLSGPRGVLSDDMLTAMLTPQYQRDPFLPAQVTLTTRASTYLLRAEANHPERRGR